MKKKAFVLFLCAVLSTGMLSGCGNSTTEPEKEQGAAPVGTETAVEGGEGEEANLNLEGFPIVNEQITHGIWTKRSESGGVEGYARNAEVRGDVKYPYGFPGSAG